MENDPSGEGDCYDTALHLLITMPAQVRDTARLVHARVTGNGPNTLGQRYGHAWVEMGDTVFDFSNGNQYVGRRERYYRAGKVDEAEVTRYTWDEAATLALRTKHYGPWPESARLTA